MLNSAVRVFINLFICLHKSSHHVTHTSYNVLLNTQWYSNNHGCLLIKNLVKSTWSKTIQDKHLLVWIWRYLDNRMQTKDSSGVSVVLRETNLALNNGEKLAGDHVSQSTRLLPLYHPTCHQQQLRISDNQYITLVTIINSFFTK